MTTIRNTPSPNRVADDVLLDAAMECVLAVGVRRTTLSDVARKAGVSRMTLYRRFPDVRGMLSAMITREFGGIIAEADTIANTRSTGRDRLVAAAIHAVRGVATNRLMHAVLERDPEMLTPYIVARLGTSQQMTEQYIRAQLERGHTDGSIRVTDVTAQARSVLLLLQSYVFSIQPATADLDADLVFAELEHGLDAMLRPREDDTE